MMDFAKNQKKDCTLKKLHDIITTIIDDVLFKED